MQMCLCYGKATEQEQTFLFDEVVDECHGTELSVGSCR